MDYPVEKNVVRFYKYYYYGIDKPITVEAMNRMQARQKLDEVMHLVPEEYRQSKVVGETVSLPVRGVTEKVVDGKTFIWVGYEKSKNGWLLKSEYKKKIEELKRKKNS